jgi:hypothetical protein
MLQTLRFLSQRTSWQAPNAAETAHDNIRSKFWQNQKLDQNDYWKGPIALANVDELKVAAEHGHRQ